MNFDDRAREIAAARADRTPFVAYDDIPDMDVAYAIQDRLAALQGETGGWKIAWNVPALMEKFGVEAPGAARVLASQIRSDGAALQAAEFRQLNLEPEIAAVLAADLPEGPHDAASVAPFVERLVPAFEVLDRRDVTSTHGPTIVAQGVFNAGLVLGTATGAGIGRCRVTIGGEVVLDAEDTAPQPPLEALAYLANLFAARGERFREGQVVLCGSHTPLLPIAAGQEAVMEVEGLGRVALTVA
ncbi:2-keto-4-pentenoate hydratase [Pontivivens ytuae]|uniref:2-keto-4-pentenoate hydratase n=1 Tax=Pontivivens ytuae TaxID=2789856 RepID=A0A7S9LQQ5_9RHOB|nr:hypothetical protein [Pontivivens ytuae]QPH53537.1 hypothetical protein I0K15_17410 [Pontivivens ytuae]